MLLPKRWLQYAWQLESEYTTYRLFLGFFYILQKNLKLKINFKASRTAEHSFKFVQDMFVAEVLQQMVDFSSPTFPENC